MPGELVSWLLMLHASLGLLRETAVQGSKYVVTEPGPGFTQPRLACQQISVTSMLHLRPISPKYLEMRYSLPARAKVYSTENRRLLYFPTTLAHSGMYRICVPAYCKYVEVFSHA